MLNERKLTENELEQRQIVLKGLLKNKHALVNKYGKDAEKVMYGIATKKAKKRVEDMNKEKLKELIQQALQNEQGPSTNVEPYHDTTTTVDTGFSGRADYGEEDKALGREDELEMRGLEEAKDWIQKAIKRPGALHRALGIPLDKDIPHSLIDKDIRKMDDLEAEEGHLDKRDLRFLRQLDLAKTLEKFNENKEPGKLTAIEDVINTLGDDDLEKIIAYMKERGRIKEAVAEEESVADYLMNHYRNPNKPEETMVDEKIVGEYYKTHPDWDLIWGKSYEDGLKDFEEFFYANYDFDDGRLDEMVKEGHGLDKSDVDFLQSLVDRMHRGGKWKAEEFKPLKRILKFIIKSNILQDKTRDLSKDKVSENLIKEFISGPLGKRNDALFSKLVPGSGDSETVEGELIRAINRIIYRWFNDGDYFYKGYGAETAGPAHSFLTNSNQIPFDLQSTLTSIFDKAMGAPEDGYERLIQFALEKVVDHVEATPEDEYTKLDRGMFDFESEFEDEEEEDDYYDEYEEEEEYYMNEDLDAKIAAIIKEKKLSKKDEKDLKKVSKELKGSSKTHKSQSDRIAKIVKEKLTKKSSLKRHIDDFKDSDAPQFKGKSADKKRKMAVAAYLSKQND